MQTNPCHERSRAVRRAVKAPTGSRGGFAVMVCFLALAVKTLPAAEVPRIDRIEWYPRYPETVTIHFDTVANKIYTLQYLNRMATNAVLTNSSTWGVWSNLYVTENLPFPTHYVIVDTATNSRQRFYRLRVTTR
jgi:hypothetical protein